MGGAVSRRRKAKVQAAANFTEKDKKSQEAPAKPPTDEEVKAATKIQAVYKGHHERRGDQAEKKKRLQAKKEGMKKEPEISKCQQIKLVGHKDCVIDVTFSPDSKKLVSASSDGSAKVWDVAEGKPLLTYAKHSGALLKARWSKDGKLIASADSNGSLKLWNSETGEDIATLDGHKGAMMGVEFHPDGKTLLSSSSESTLKLWNIADGSSIGTLKGHTDSIFQCLFNHDGSKILSASFDKSLRIWDTATCECLQVLEGHTDVIRSCAFNSDGGLVVSAGNDKSIKVWDVNTGRLLISKNGNFAAISHVSFSPDDFYIATCHVDSMLRFWEYSLEKESCTMAAKAIHNSPVYEAKFSPAGWTILTRSDGGNLQLWESGTDLLYDFQEVPGVLNSMGCNDTMTHFAGGDEMGKVHLLIPPK